MKALFLDVSRCTGCKSCELGCSVEQSESKDLFLAFMKGERPNRYISVQYADGQPVPVTCAHCEDPPCARVCPTEAISKTDEGQVLVSIDRCIGCRYCVIACPFGAMGVDISSGLAAKCNLCKQRTEKGLLPRCVESCPTGALRYGDTEEFVLEKKFGAAMNILAALKSGREILGGGEG